MISVLLITALPTCSFAIDEEERILAVVRQHQVQLLEIARLKKEGLEYRHIVKEISISEFSPENAELDENGNVDILLRSMGFGSDWGVMFFRETPIEDSDAPAIKSEKIRGTWHFYSH